MNELNYIDVTEPPYNAPPSLPDNTSASGRKVQPLAEHARLQHRR